MFLRLFDKFNIYLTQFMCVFLARIIRGISVLNCKIIMSFVFILVLNNSLSKVYEV